MLESSELSAQRVQLFFGSTKKGQAWENSFSDGQIHCIYSCGAKNACQACRILEISDVELDKLKHMVEIGKLFWKDRNFSSTLKKVFIKMKLSLANSIA